MILYFRCLCNQLQLIFNKELKMNRKKKNKFGNNFIESGEHKEQGNCNIRPQRCSSSRELPAAPPRELRAADGEITETQGKTEDAPAGKTFHSLNFTNQRDGGELLTGSGGSTQPPQGSLLQHPEQGRNRNCQGLMQWMKNHAANHLPQPLFWANPTRAGGQNSLKYSRKETQSTLQPESKQK